MFGFAKSTISVGISVKESENADTGSFNLILKANQEKVVEMVVPPTALTFNFPLFVSSQSLGLKVCYCCRAKSREKNKKNNQMELTWSLPLLSEFLELVE